MRKEASNADPAAPGTSSVSVPGKESVEWSETTAEEELLGRHLPWLRGWLRARLHGHRRQDVDDLCQDILLRALRGMHRLRRRERLAAWLYRIANNLLRDYFRRQRRCQEVSGLEVDPPGELDVEALVDRDDEARRLLQRVSALPSKYREPMILRHVHDLSYDEIAEILGITTNNVQVRIFRARRMLRDALSGQDAGRVGVRDRNPERGSAERSGVGP